jgi:lantibiotic biosynthesis protein
LEKYGIGREVPLLDLLDVDRGLGLPRTYQNQKEAPETKRSKQEKIREQRLSQHIARVVRDRETELELTDELIAEFELVEPDFVRAPMSMELYVSLVADSPSAVDSGDYQLIVGANQGSQGAGQTFGRFADMLGTPLLEQLGQIHQMEQKLRPEAVFAEVVMLPSEGRLANLALSVNTRPYEIAMGVSSSKEPSKTIPVSDLLVGVTLAGFYLRSRSLGVRVIPTKSHMLNPQTSTLGIYRFLSDLMLEETRPWWGWDWGNLSTRSFLPRLRYQRTVLSPATWRLNHRILPQARNVSDCDFVERLQAWRTKWNVPRFVYLKATDHRILLDLEQPLHQEELQRAFDLLMGEKSLIVTEAGQVPGHGVVQGEEGSYWNEFVIPLVRETHPATPIRKRPLTTIKENERLKMPGSEWLYSKVYGTFGREDEFIGLHLEPFCRAMEEKGLVERSFFIRYSDPDSHLRIRFYGNPTKLMSECLPLFHQWMMELQEKKLASHFVLDTYDREIERYGGVDVMSLAEKVFASDSRTVAAWLGEKRVNRLSVNLETLAVHSTIDLLGEFASTRDGQMSLLEAFVDTKAHQQEFREQRALLTDVEVTKTGRVAKGLDDRRDSLREYVQVLQQAQDIGRLTNPYESVALSVLHIHLNRLLRPTRDEEKKIVTLAYLTLNAWKHMGK